jgi:hypothetical protein
VLRDVDHHRDRAQREAEPARPDRLLADDALVERNALVYDAALELADADRAEHEVRAVERLVEARRRPERKVRLALLFQTDEHGSDLREAPLVEVVQHDLFDPDPLCARQQRAEDHRHAEPASAEHRDLHCSCDRNADHG